MYVSVTGVRPLDNYTLELVFENHEKKIFDVTPYLSSGVFQRLKDKNFFNKVALSFHLILLHGLMR